MSKTVTVALIQTATSSDVAANMQMTAAKIEQAAQRGAQIVCLQELYRTRYFPQAENVAASEMAETIPGPSTTLFGGIAKKYGIVIIAPLFEHGEDGKYYNTAAVVGTEGQIIGKYRKVHIPQDSYFYEKEYFEEGNQPFQVFDTPFARIGVLICYDQWFPEAARIDTLQGAEILFYPTAIGYVKGYTSADGDWHDAWRTVQRAHAIANGVHVAAVNRVGEEDELEFWGGSFICDSWGKVLAEAGDSEEIVVAKLDLALNKHIQEGWGFLRNRRPDTYKTLTQNVAVEAASCSELGYRMPAEWQRHTAIWLAWPYDPLTFPDRVDRVEQTYVQIVKEIHTSEEVNLFVRDETTKQKATEMFTSAGIDLSRVHFHVFGYADVWFRDYGPIFVRNPRHELAMIHWEFNSWGEKYETLLKDKEIPTVINQKMAMTCYRPGIVMEGGSIDVNGEGTLLTTEACLLNSNRNPDLKKEDIERNLSEYLGVRHFIWLKRGILGDDTDGHIDDLARFVDPQTIVCAYEDNSDDADYEALKENYDLLMESTDQDGKPLRVIKLPMPKVEDEEGCRLPASYTNFYIGNTKVLVPVFNHPNDQKALQILQELFPTRKVVGIYCGDLVYGFGTLHCISQQQPCPG